MRIPRFLLLCGPKSHGGSDGVGHRASVKSRFSHRVFCIGSSGNVRVGRLAIGSWWNMGKLVFPGEWRLYVKSLRLLMWNFFKVSFLGYPNRRFWYLFLCGLKSQYFWQISQVAAQRPIWVGHHCTKYYLVSQIPVDKIYENHYVKIRSSKPVSMNHNEPF